MAPTEIKAALGVALGSQAEPYWRTLSDFLQGKMSRAEFEDLMADKLNTPHLKQLHNTLLMEIIGAACTSEPDTLTASLIAPSHKRRRVHPYQGDMDDTETYHSARLKYWVVSIPKSERDDLRVLGAYTESHSREQRALLEEVRQESGYEVDPQRRPIQTPLALCTLTKTLPSLPDLHERIRAISAEHGLQLKPSSSRTFTRLFNQALEDILVKIITSTLTTITRSDSQYESIQPPSRPLDSDPFSSRHNNNKVTISVVSLATTFYITPSIISFPSPALLRAMMQDFQWPKEEEEVQPKGQKDLNLSAKPIADYYRLVRGSRSGGPVLLQEFPMFQ